MSRLLPNRGGDFWLTIRDKEESVVVSREDDVRICRSIVEPTHTPQTLSYILEHGMGLWRRYMRITRLDGVSNRGDTANHECHEKRPESLKKKTAEDDTGVDKGWRNEGRWKWYWNGKIMESEEEGDPDAAGWTVCRRIWQGLKG